MDDDGDEQQYCLRWNNFQANITSQFEALRDDEDFTDVSIVCDGRRIQAHRVVLSACSPLFKELFKNNPCTHPIIFMRDVDAQSVASLLEFMYAGEVNVAQAHLSSFLRTAESLQIRGLTDPNTDVVAKNKVVKGTKEEKVVHAAHDTHESDKTPVAPADRQPNTQPEQSRLSALHLENERDVPDADNNNEAHNLNINNNNSNTKENNNMAHGGIEGDITMRQMKIELPEFSEYFSDVEVDDDHQGHPGYTAIAAEDIPQSSMKNFKSLLSHGYRVQTTGNVATRSVCVGLPQTSLTARTCDECGRTYSNLSNLRQHMRLVHFPTHPACAICQRRFKTDLYLKRHMHHSHLPMTTRASKLSHRACRLRNWTDFVEDDRHLAELASATSNQIIKLADGIEVPAEQLRAVKLNDYRKLTRGLAAILFRPEELASCSVTGQRWSRAGNDPRPVKPALDRAKVQAIISYVASRFPMIEISRIKQVLAYKCKENSTAFKMKAVRYFADQCRDGTTK